MKRGRKSSAELSIVTGLPQRPEPPAELTAEQGREWQEIVSRLPADWFRREIFPVLVQYCRHVVSARSVAKLANDAVNSVDLADPETLRRYDTLGRMQEREGKAVARLATKLRITPQSRYTPASAAAAAGKGTPGRKPWE